MTDWNGMSDHMWAMQLFGILVLVVLDSGTYNGESP
jgi:hypothetical protein